jgi:hypothetical protein
MLRDALLIDDGERGERPRCPPELPRVAHAEEHPRCSAAALLVQLDQLCAQVGQLRNTLVFEPGETRRRILLSGERRSAMGFRFDGARLLHLALGFQLLQIVEERPRFSSKALRVGLKGADALVDPLQQGLGLVALEGSVLR